MTTSEKIAIEPLNLCGRGFERYQFFKGMHEKQTSSGSEFTKGKTRYETFPERLVVDVQATIYKCQMKPDQLDVPGFGEGLMSDPSFKLNWRDESRNLTPVKPFSESRMREMRLSGSMSGKRKQSYVKPD